MGMFPKLNGKSHLGVKIPALSGGLNEFDAVNLVDDNQLTQCENMWFDGGMLKTRPGFTLKQEGMFKLVSQNEGNLNDVRYISNNITVMLEGKIYKLMAAVCDCDNGDVISFYLVCGDGTVITLSEIRGIKGYYDEEGKWQEVYRLLDVIKFENCLLCKYENKIYAYVKICVHFYDGGTTTEYKVFSLTNLENFINPNVKNPDWTEVTEFEVPLTMTNLRANGGGILSGDSVRSYNILNGAEKIEIFAFTTPNAFLSYETSFKLDFKLRIGSKVNLELICNSGSKLNYSCTITNEKKIESDLAENNTFLYIEQGQSSTFISLHLRNDSGADQTWYVGEVGTETNSDYISKEQPNVTLTYYREVSEEEKDRIFCATRCEWFGTEGLNGGSRLFVGGNTNEKHKNLLHYSGSLNPLYFPENCYMRVGDNSQTITALAKQSDMLVIFSERQMHYITYQSGASVTAEDITENGQYDLTVLNATFPLTQINDKVGCDCPDTVQLCRNRLVWATKDGKVYVLMGASQYSERNVYELSRNIEHSLKAAMKDSGIWRYFCWTGIKACDWQGKYVLQAGSKMFVMDYDENAFAYISSYSDSVKAQKNIVWHIWDTGYRFESLFSDGETIMAVYSLGHWCELLVCDGTAEKDMQCTNIKDDYDEISGMDFVAEFEECDIEASFQTKVFDFNNPGIKKSVDQVYVGFGGNGEKEINVTFVSEKGEQYRSLFPHCADTSHFSAGYVSVARFLPCLSHVTRLGIKIESKGNLSINNITINYRLLGGVR